ncbi:fucolectin-like [Littorina saxatilis]|uniref:fucolectin-like n=1 Tax=Littorina saxatilis TaxID=31220 RepID=UPI0038B46AD8
MSFPRKFSPGCGGAVNGNTSGVYMDDGSNCIHTSGKQNNSWWEVNLGRPYAVHSITVWARGEITGTNFLFRMEGIEITVDGKECYKFDSAPTKREIAINCSSGVLSGTVIRVYKNATAAGIQRPNHTINICEFQVFSCTDGYWGIDCSEKCGNCSNSEVCDKVTGHCSSCSPGLKPPLCRAGICFRCMPYAY